MVSHDPLAPQSTHVANTPDFEEEEVIMQGGRLEGEKDLVKLVGRKRRLPVEEDEEDTDYLPPAKRPEYAVEEADKQSAGCTDEWMVPSPTLYDESSSDHSESEEDEQEETEEIIVPYPPPRTWVAKVEWALARLGGKGTLADIYSAIEEVFPEEVDGKRNWKAAIRSCLSKNEKRKFLKPSTGLASKDHLWCLVPRDSSRAPPKRGRPAGRRRIVTPTPALRRDTDAALQERELPELLTVDTAQVPTSEYAVGETDLEKEQKIAHLLRQKQLLEDDINRLLQEQQESGEGLSPDQEDWLSHLLA